MYQYNNSPGDTASNPRLYDVTEKCAYVNKINFTLRSHRYDYICI